MMNENEQTIVSHPDGKIILMNGNVLDCYPKKDQPSAIIPDEIGLDTTGEWLNLKKRTARRQHEIGLDTTGESMRFRDVSKRQQHPVSEPWEELFYKEAFFLYEHKEQILADSRMFLTPLPFKNGLAYTGTSGFRDATLGIYLEWWEACERAVIKKDGIIQALTYYIAGSPLTGSNRCSTVDKNGIRETIQFSSPFMPIWRPFIQINQRYTEAKQIYQAYTLEETISKLREA